MRAKKFGALFLAGTMMTGTIGIMSPQQVEAATPANAYTMTVPADMNNLGAEWNELGKISVKGTDTIDMGTAVIVTAKTTNDFKLKSGEETIPYTMKTSEFSAPKTEFTFWSSKINAGEASENIGVYVEDFSANPVGAYTDTITFTGSMKVTTVASAIPKCHTLQLNFEEETYYFSEDGETVSTYKYETTWSRTEDGGFIGTAFKVTNVDDNKVIFDLKGDDTWYDPYDQQRKKVTDMLEFVAPAVEEGGYAYSILHGQVSIFAEYYGSDEPWTDSYFAVGRSSIAESVEIIVDGNNIADSLKNLTWDIAE